MGTWKTGTGTVSLGLIIVGVLIILNSYDLVPNEALKYLGSVLIILFGIEIIWSHISKPGMVRYSFWSVFVLMIVFALSVVQFIFPQQISWQPKVSGPVSGQYTVDSSIKKVDIQIPSGRVNITGITGQMISYEGQLAANANSSADSDSGRFIQDHWTVRQNGDTLELFLDAPDSVVNLFNWSGWWEKSLYLNIQLPNALAAKVHTRNGSVTVGGIHADMDIKTSNGGISVKDIQGNVNAITSNGGITIVEVDGSADIHTSNGPITITNVSGAMTARSSNGAVKATSHINAAWSLDTSNGSITMTLPQNTNASIQGRTSNGGFKGELNWLTKPDEKKKASGTLGTGANLVNLSTSNGSVSVNFGG